MKVFISYSRKDASFVQQIKAIIEKFGHHAWFDEGDDGIIPGEHWMDRLKHEIENSDILLFLMSPYSLASDNCAWELELARTTKTPIIPVKLVPGIILKDDLKETDCLDLSSGIDHLKSAELLRAIEKIGKQKQSASHNTTTSENAASDNVETPERPRTFIGANSIIKDLVSLIRSSAEIIGPAPAGKADLHGCAYLQMTTWHNILVNQIENTERDIFRILVSGEFSVGKSTLLNALFGKDILPVGILPVTTMITEILPIPDGKQEPFALVYFESQPNPEEYTLPAFRENFVYRKMDTPQNQEFYRSIKYASVHFDNPLLHLGVRLVDSPGLNANDYHTEITTDVFVRSKAIVFVLDARRLLSQSEKDYLRTRLSGEIRPNRRVFFVINYINMVNKDAKYELEQFLKEQLAIYFENPKTHEIDEVLYGKRIFFVDAHGALQARLRNDMLVYQESGVAKFETCLEQFLTSDETLYAEIGFLSQLVKSMFSQAKIHIANEKKLRALPLKQLQDELSKIEKHRFKIATEQIKLRNEAPKYSKEIKNNVISSFESYIVQMQREWQTDGGRYFSFRSDINGQSADFDEVRKQLTENTRKYIRDKFRIWVSTEVGPLILSENNRVEAAIREYTQKIEHDITEIWQRLGVSSETRDPNDLMGKLIKINVDDIVRLLQKQNMKWDQLAESVASYLIYNENLQKLRTSRFGQLFDVPWVGDIMKRLMVGSPRIDKTTLLKNLGSSIHEEIVAKIPSMRHTIDKLLDDYFGSLISEVANRVDNELEDFQKTLKRAFKQKEEEGGGILNSMKAFDETEVYLGSLVTKIDNITEI